MINIFFNCKDNYLNNDIMILFLYHSIYLYSCTVTDKYNLGKKTAAVTDMILCFCISETSYFKSDKLEKNKNKQ